MTWKVWVRTWVGEVSSIFPQWLSISDAIELSSSKWPLNTLSDRLNKKLNTTLSDKQNNIGSMHMFYMLVLWLHITFLLSFSPKFIFISNLPLLVGWHGGKEGNTRKSWAAGWKVFHSNGKSGRRQCESKPSKCMLIMSSSMSSTPTECEPGHLTASSSGKEHLEWTSCHGHGSENWPQKEPWAICVCCSIHRVFSKSQTSIRNFIARPSPIGALENIAH